MAEACEGTNENRKETRSTEYLWYFIIIIKIGLLAFHKYIHRNNTNIIHQLFLLPTAHEPCRSGT
jgi:hypothetical protein